MKYVKYAICVTEAQAREFIAEFLANRASVDDIEAIMDTLLIHAPVQRPCRIVDDASQSDYEELKQWKLTRNDLTRQPTGEQKCLR